MTTATRAPTRRLCPVCGGVAPLGFGRPKTYCSTVCRREMADRRRRLAELEAEIDEAHVRLRDGYSPGAYYWRATLARLTLQAAELRAQTVEALR